MSDIKLRTESIRDDEFIDLAVTNDNDKKVITHRLKRWLDGCEQSQRLPLSSVSS